jgi:rubrerythrin
MSEDAKGKLDSLLMDALNAEAKAREFYRDAAHKAASNAGKSLFNELADFEQGHYDRLKTIIEARNKGMKIERPPVEDIAAKSEVEGQSEPNKDEISKVLALGIEAEKKAQAKYMEIAQLFEDAESKNIFNDMAEEERKHQKILEDQFFHMSNKGRIIWGD